MRQRLRPLRVRLPNKNRKKNKNTLNERRNVTTRTVTKPDATPDGLIITMCGRRILMEAQEGSANLLERDSPAELLEQRSRNAVTGDFYSNY